MGCCGGGNPEERKRNDEIDKQIKADRTKMTSEVKLLLLGAGESGKSTILKQMRLIHDQGYSVKDREAFKEIIFSNTIQSMRAVNSRQPSAARPRNNPALSSNAVSR